MRFQFFWHKRPSDADHAGSRPDPIDHPAIAAMSVREIADLPLWARYADVDPAPGRAAAKQSCETPDARIG